MRLHPQIPSAPPCCCRVHTCRLAANSQRANGCLLTRLANLLRSLGAAAGDRLQLRPRGRGAAEAVLLKAGEQAA